LEKEWGKKFPQEKLDAAREKAKLKRLATVEVCGPGPEYRTRKTTGADNLSLLLIQDVAQQVLLLVESQSITGTNAVIDAGWKL